MKKTPDNRLALLNAGTIPASNLAEILAVDFSVLIKNVVPNCRPHLVQTLKEFANQGIVKRMALAARLLLNEFGPSYVPMLARHSSDAVRGWACFMIAFQQDVLLAKRLAAMRVFADDEHFGVREWAWLAMRPHIADDLDAALTLLEPWTREDSEFLRRFASESTRPRGVWSAHISRLKKEPQVALPILEPLRSDNSRYVQNSVANWLNDASKSMPLWVQDVCARWQRESQSAATRRICQRALRSLKQ